MALDEKKVRMMISEKLGVDYEKVVPQAGFQGDLGADSLDMVEIVMAFEDEYNIEIPDEDSEKIKTVKDALDYLGNRL